MSLLENGESRRQKMNEWAEDTVRVLGTIERLLRGDRGREL